MELNEYQAQAMTTCMASSDNFSYMFLNLVGEVGEFASKVAKAVRKDNAVIGLEHNQLAIKLDCEKELRHELMLEAGDILWQLSGLCHTMNWDLEYVARKNLEKLATRKANGTIDGIGDGVTKEERGVKEVKTAPSKPRKVSVRKGYQRTDGIQILTSKPDKRLYKDRQALTRDGVDINMVYQGERDLKIKGYKYGHKVFYAYGDYIKLKNRLTGRLF